jgi:RND family efflux transporter MFP subunit
MSEKSMFSASRLRLAWLGLAALLAGCRQQPAAYQPPPPPEVSITRPVVREIEDTLEVTGVTRGVETVELRARVQGFLLEKNVEGGERVKAGEELFTIDPRPFSAVVREAQAEVAAREADLALAHVTLERLRRAISVNAASKEEEDRAAAELERAQAQVDLAKAKLSRALLDLEFTAVKTPIDGRVSFVSVERGDLVGADGPTLLATVINDSIVYATYDLSEQTVLELRKATDGRRPREDGRPHMPIRLGMMTDDGYPHMGRFDKADNTVNPTTGTIRCAALEASRHTAPNPARAFGGEDVTAAIRCEAIFENPEGTILPGAFVRLQSLLGIQEAMLIPEVAVQTDQAGKYVLVVNDRDVVERRNVTVGRTLDQMTVVRSGLTHDDRVIYNGIQRARPGMTVKPQDIPPKTTTRPANSTSAPFTTTAPVAVR